MEQDYIIIPGDVVNFLQSCENNSFDACLCDPPYLLEFMGKEFDRQHLKMSGDNDGQKMYQWHLRWCREMFRVLKPGGFILAFGGTRTSHRLECALEDVGFEIRDTIEWMYGSGFPKSLDIGKQIEEFDGYGTALKPAHEPIILAMKPCQGNTFAENALEYGVAGLNIDECRIVWKSDSDKKTGRPVSLPKAHEGFEGKSFKISDRSNRNPEQEQSQLGRWPANLILQHCESCTDSVCHPLCPVRLLDEQSGITKSNPGVRRNRNKGHEGWSHGTFRTGDLESTHNDSGGASRFFYCAKVSTRERNLGGIDCKHPTLKPIDLCRYLATLLLPPARESSPRKLLIPFSGAGSEIAGSLLAGWDEIVGIEMNHEYISWAESRIEYVLQHKEEFMKPKSERAKLPRIIRQIGNDTEIEINPELFT